jgi:protein-disulfide isomerase
MIATDSRAAALAGCLTLSCVAQSSCAPARPAQASNEIVLGAVAGPDPSPLGTVKPCPKDAAPGGCGASSSDTTALVPGARYDVAVLATDPARGPANAPISVVVFSDFQCPFCAGLVPTLEDLRERYPNTLRVVWKDHPLAMHAWALPAALLAREAYDRGGEEAFWSVHDRIFDDQEDIDEAALEELAGELGLSWPPRPSTAVDDSVRQGHALGVRSTPTTFVNGRAVIGDQPIETFTKLIDDELHMRGTPQAP